MRFRNNAIRKTLFLLTALGSVSVSAALAEVWMGDHAHQIMALLLVGGLLLYAAALALFGVRVFQWQRVLKKHEINLGGWTLFRKSASIQPYQRETWLQMVLVFLTLLVLSFAKADLGTTSTLSICLTLVLLLLVYTLLSTDFDLIVRDSAC